MEAILKQKGIRQREDGLYEIIGFFRGRRRVRFVGTLLECWNFCKDN